MHCPVDESVSLDICFRIPRTHCGHVPVRDPSGWLGISYADWPKLMKIHPLELGMGATPTPTMRSLRGVGGGSKFPKRE